MDDEDFLAAVEADNANLAASAEPETPEPEAAEPVAEPEAAEPPKEPEPAPANPLEAPVVEAKPDPGFVPITVVLDEREKRQRAEQELAQFRAQQQQPQPEAPDMFADPDGFAAYQDQKVQQALYLTNLRWSERTAAIEHGAETVAKAKDWGIARCDQDPYFNAKVAASPDPVGFVVSEWKREQIASQVTPEDLAQFQAWKAAQAQIQAPTPTPAGAAPSTPPRSTPPRSLASAPSAGGVLTEVEQSDEEIFEETFSRN